MNFLQDSNKYSKKTSTQMIKTTMPSPKHDLSRPGGPYGSEFFHVGQASCEIPAIDNNSMAMGQNDYLNTY